MVTSDVGKIKQAAVSAGRKLPGEGMAGSGLGFQRSFCLHVENPRGIRGKGRGGGCQGQGQRWEATGGDCNVQARGDTVPVGGESREVEVLYISQEWPTALWSMLV